MVLDAREQVLDANVKPPTYMPMSSNEFLTMVSEQIKKKREDTQYVINNPEWTPEMVKMLTKAYIEAEVERQEWLNLASDNEEYWWTNVTNIYYLCKYLVFSIIFLHNHDLHFYIKQINKNKLYKHFCVYHNHNNLNRHCKIF